jgi:hypothetical protein
MRKHILTNHKPDERLADCTVCGPSVRVKYRRHDDRWLCMSIQAKRGPGYLERQRTYSRERARFARYGMSPSQYKAMFARQQGRCAICLESSEPERLVIDHCHDTDVVRGLLCHACNKALGFMRDDPERLLRAVAYLT